MRQAPVLGATIDKLLLDIFNTPVGRQQSLNWRRAWFFTCAAKDAHRDGDYALARSLMCDAKESFEEV